MGRRKIEIKAIKDDRNRSVTFLKRKGGLFKKAHELSVLCSVDVAVIIFGSNKKLYEYSSGDIGEIMSRYQFYGGANEHKGPADFSGKGKDLDDDDDDDGSGMSQHGGGSAAEAPMMPPQFQNQAAFQHIRHQTPSASPPIPNGTFHPHPPRQHTPQHDSRPPSRNAPRRQSSNLVPQQHVQPPPANNYAYMPNPPMYNPSLPPQQHSLPPRMQGPPMQTPHHGVPSQGPQYPNYASPQQHPHQHPHPQQVQQLYSEEQRRSSIPAAFPQQDTRPPQIKTEPSPPQPPPQIPPHQQPETHEEEQQQSQQRLEPVKRMSTKSRSIFTPIDESRSILSQHWASSTSTAETPRSETATTISSSRSMSLDVGPVSRMPHQTNSPPRPVRSQTHDKLRNISMSSVPEGFPTPSRTNSASLGGGKRPVLKVQIPDEPSDEGSGSEDTSPRSSTKPAIARRNGQPQDHPTGSCVVLPPPSPSASALLSAGASGPPNPFARPHHPVTQTLQNSTSNGNLIDTPVSALPSRFMTNEFLPSPSSFYPDWNFSREGNTLPSPLNFATPVVGSGPSFLREGSGERDKNLNGTKRKTPEAEGGGGEETGDQKRLKHDG